MWQWKKQRVYKTGALPQTPAFVALKPTAYVKKAAAKRDTSPCRMALSQCSGCLPAEPCPLRQYRHYTLHAVGRKAVNAGGLGAKPPSMIDAGIKDRVEVKRKVKDLYPWR